MAEILLFHSALGPRPGIAVAAERLRAAGHVVHVPDIFPEPRVFDETGPAIEYINGIGFEALAARAVASVQALPGDLVYAGFSLATGYAATLAATRPGARAALLLNGTPGPDGLGAASWPPGVPVQVHSMAGDPWRDNDALARMADFVRASGSDCSVFDYPGTAHLFADPSLPEQYDPAAADLMWKHVLGLLSDLDGAAPRRAPDRQSAPRAGGAPGNLPATVRARGPRVGEVGRD
ncbi:MAG: dienelactone hydrolase family protein [Candidatus Limnocylindrales bacterium]